MEKPIGYNVHQTVTHAATTMAYFEQHHILEIYRELYMRVSRDRPENLREYVGVELKKIAHKYAVRHTNLLVPPVFDPAKMSLTYGKQLNCPVIKYTKKRTNNDFPMVLDSYKRFAKYYGLWNKHLITFNFPQNRVEVLQGIANHFVPTNVIEIIPNLQIPYKSRRQLEAENRAFISDFKQVKDYFPHRSMDMKLNTNWETFCRRVDQITKTPIGTLGDHRIEAMGQAGEWRPRIMITGRRGSGRKTQAACLAKRLGLVYINVDFLILKYVQNDPELSKIFTNRARAHMRCGNPMTASIVQKRIMKPDCLRNGYILVGFPNCYNDADMIDSTFAVKPNSIIFLHCRLRECQRRLERFIERKEQIAYNPLFTRDHFNDPRLYRPNCAGLHLMKHPADAYSCVEIEHINYSMNIRPLVKHYGDRKDVSHVDGNHSAATVQRNILATVVKPKYNETSKRARGSLEPEHGWKSKSKFLKSMEVFQNFV